MAEESDPLKFVIPKTGDFESKFKAFEEYCKNVGIIDIPKYSKDVWQRIFSSSAEIDMFDLMLDYYFMGIKGGEPPKIRLRDMDAYCKKMGKEPKDLTPEELAMFSYE